MSWGDGIYNYYDDKIADIVSAADARAREAREKIEALQAENEALKTLAFRLLRELINPVCCPPEFCEYTEWANGFVIEDARKLGVAIPEKEEEP